jgi:two-component system, NtrC family, sensor kinase
MHLLDISLQYRVIIGISAMVLLFGSFLIVFITNQRKKLQYHKNLQAIHQQQQQQLIEQNLKLEDRVKERTTALLEQKENLQVALTNLKASQQQLVQKEKMASLGEVASGIAHEIQNPLNFVNNFSEITEELVLEMKALLAAENGTAKTTEEIDLLVEDIVQNLKKINHHGRRADNIVKNMLQHGRSSGNEIVLTDVNYLANEYINLAYHAFKVKDKTFHAVINTALDPTLEKINIIAEDIGRVLMNIYDNAFYAVSEKSKKNEPGYGPTITLTTKNEGNKIKIIIRDNGVGIAKKYADKIYQPFFTSKPTGTGTGLGLSLSYDIIKAHQGEIKVESVEGEFAEFTIELLYD